MSLLGELKGLVSMPDHQFNLQSDYLANIRNVYGRVARYSRYRIRSKEGLAALERAGIATSDAPTDDHEHPVCKTIEEYILREVIPHHFTPPSRIVAMSFCEPRS